MPGIDKNRPFKPVGIAILTVSDSRSKNNDTSGRTLIDRLEGAGHRLADYRIVPDDVDSVTAAIREWIDDSEVDVVISTGGTGVTGRDVTPEAVESLYDKPIPGFGELFRSISYDVIGTSTIQSRATAGVSGGTFLFALPGSTGACKDAWDNILKDQLDFRYLPCNFVELMPRLTER